MPDPFVHYLKTRARQDYERVLEHYSGSVSRLLRRLLPAAAVEETAQEVFLRLANTQKLPEEILRPRAYVLRLALHVAQQRLRAEELRSRHESNAGRSRPLTSPPASEEAMLRERVSRILAAINELPRTLRVPMHLRAVEGLSYKEIGHILDINTDVVGMRILRARQKLRKKLGAAWSLSWLAGLPWGRDGALAAATKAAIMDRSPGPPAGPMAAARGATRGGLARLPTGAGIVVLSLGVLCYLLTAQASTPPARRMDAPAMARELDEAAVPRPSVVRPDPDAMPEVDKPRGPLASVPPNTALPLRANVVSQTQSDGKVSPTPPQPEGPGMSNQTVSFAAASISALAFAAASHGAEPGDTDGDGILSIADVAWIYGDPADPSTFHPPALGSVDLYVADPGCMLYLPEDGQDTWLRNAVAPNLMTEVLRRAVQSPLPNWYPVLDQSISSAPLSPDARVRVWIENVRAGGGADDSARIVLGIESFAEITHFLLILESDQGVVRMDWGPRSPDQRESWSEYHWMTMGIIRRRLSSEETGEVGDVSVGVGPGMSLVSPETLALSFGFRRGSLLGPERLAPGSYLINIKARLPRGASPGKYRLRLLPTSQVLLEDWSVFAPTIDGSGELTVERAVESGWNEGRVPLEVNSVQREVLGDIQLRLVDADGNAGEAARFQGQPGDDIKVRAQIRTAVPLNELMVALAFPRDKLLCEPEEDRHQNLFVNPEDGLLYHPARRECHPFGSFWIRYELAGYQSNRQFEGNDLRYPGRILEYFKPLGEWTDLFEVTFAISVRAIPGEEIPLLMPYEPLCSETPGGPGTPAQIESHAQFHPYSRNWVECSTADDPLFCRWTYPGLKLTGSKILVVEGPPPPPPPDYEIVLSLGNVAGQPGELVEVPVFASAAQSLNLLRLVLELDPAVGTLESAALVVENSSTFEARTEVVLRGEHPVFYTCWEEDVNGDGDLDRICRDDSPAWVVVHDTEARNFVLDLRYRDVGFPRAEPSLLATLRVRIAADPAAGEAFVRPERVFLEDVQVPFVAETGGTLFGSTEAAGFSPGSIDGGKITVIGFQPKQFLRGDANGDRKVDLSDAVATLGYLFLGHGGLPCLKAADADDSGVIEITDSIYLLGYLFLGQRPIPAPHPGCGEDPSPDVIGCRQGCQE